MRVVNITKKLLVLTGVTLALPQPGFGGFSGQIMVYAWDSSSGTNPPPSTEVYLNEHEVRSFGTNDLVTFSGQFEEGTNIVEVLTSTEGYLLRQSPVDAHALSNPDSDYGNPRHIVISEGTNEVPVSFQFDPVVTVSARVRDAWTMESLGDAALEFDHHTEGSIWTVSEYPWNAAYATNWTTDARGHFPSNVILYAMDADLVITRHGYKPYVESSAIINVSPGDVIHLGTIFLEPLDTNTNLIADSWETRFFGTGTSINPNDDTDGDGMSNFEEYVAGTNPTNSLSCLSIDASQHTNGFTLTWPVEADHTYRVCGTTNLLQSNTWVQVGGPWQALGGQSEMSWTETNMDLSWNSSYRVEVMPCWWQGTNYVLINTNMPAIASGTNTWDGEGPPVPGD